MHLTFSFISVLLALAAAQDFYDRFNVRQVLEDAIDDYLIARDDIWDEAELFLRTLPPAGKCGLSLEGEFGCIPKTGGQKCGECQPGSIGASCLCDPQHTTPEPAHPATPNSHGGSTPDSHGGSTPDSHKGNSRDSSPKAPSDDGSQRQSSPDSQASTESSRTTTVSGMCFTYSRGGITDKMCQYKHPLTERWRNCLDRDVCATPQAKECTCRVTKAELLVGNKDRKQSPDGSPSGPANKRQKVAA